MPFIFDSFSGFLVVLNIGDRFYKFTTINKSKMEIIRKDNDVVILFSRKNLELKVRTLSKKSLFMQFMGSKESATLQFTTSGK